MNNYTKKWSRMFIQTQSMSLNDKEVLLSTNTTFDSDIIMLYRIIFYEETMMNKGSSNFYGLLLQVAAQEVTMYIRTSFNLTQAQIESSVSKEQKMLQKIERLIKGLCDKWGLKTVDSKYGQLRWALIKDNDRYQSNVINIWTSIFCFFWLVTSTEDAMAKMTEADMRTIIGDFHTIVGYEEFKIFAYVCLCAHRLFCVLPLQFAKALELAVNA